MPYIPLSKEQLEAKHAAYVSSMEANSPARQAFIIAFSLDPMTKTTATPGPLSESSVAWQAMSLPFPDFTRGGATGGEAKL